MTTPPPIPTPKPSPPIVPGPLQRPVSAAEPGMEHYHTIADTVGGIPNLRPRDNAFQAIFVAATVVLGACIGALMILLGLLKGVPFPNWYIGAIVGAILGLFVGTFLSGGVLMIRGWVRTANKRK